MKEESRQIQSQITFLYYNDLQSASDFYAGIMGFELVEDQTWAKIYRSAGGAFIGIVAGERGFHQPRQENSVLITLLVDDVAGWYAHLRDHAVRIVQEMEDRPDIGVRCFFLEDPGGYTLEIQRFLKPELAAIFHAGP